MFQNPKIASDATMTALASYRLMVHLKVALEPFDTRPSQYQVGQYRALFLRLLKAFILVRLDAASHHARRASTGHSTEPCTMAIGKRCQERISATGWACGS